MPSYDFHSLSALDFEELVRDLLQAEWKVRLESFKSGRDQGIDLRYSTASGKKTVIQCKHFVGSGFSKLLTHLRDVELPKVNLLAPARYVVATSVGLTPANKDAILAAMSPHIKETADIFGASELNGLLGKFGQIEQANFKLWLTSVEVLQRVLHNAEKCQTDFEVDRINRKLSLYVQSDAYARALTILDETNVVVISGPPGIGKTTLAEMLLYQHLERGYEPAVIKSDISEGKAVYSPLRKQIFYFDDFLGQTFFRDQLGFLFQNQDTVLVDFIDLIRKSKTTRFILTTREHILKNALIASERLQDDKSLEGRCVLQISDYSFGQKARILYNHLYFSDLPQHYKENLIENDFYLKAIRHQNYNPRLIEWLSGYSRIKSTPPGEYNALFLRVLENPQRVWQHAFKQQISEAARNVLLALYSLAGRDRFDRLETAWNALQNYKAIKYNFSMAPGEFREALKELEGGFITLDRHHAQFNNPSVKDFLSALLIESPEHATDIIASATFCDQVAQVWQVAQTSNGENLNRYLAQKSDIVTDTLKRVLENKYSETFTDQTGATYGSRFDASIEERLNLLASVVAQIRTTETLGLMKQLTDELVDAWDGGFPEFSEALPILGRFEAAIENADGDFKEQLVSLFDATKQKLIENYRHATAEYFESLFDYSDLSSFWTEPDTVALRKSFNAYLSDGYYDEKNDNNSSGALAGLRDSIAYIGKKLEVGVQYEIDTLEEDIAEREEAESRYSAGDRRIEAKATKEFEDEAEVRRMFDSLREALIPPVSRILLLSTFRCPISATSPVQVPSKAWMIEGTSRMKSAGLARLFSLSLVTGISAGALALMSAEPAQARGWGSVHRYVKPSGNCAGGQEILASHYASGKRTATGERFDANGNTAAARTFALGTSLTVTNPQNGRSLTVRVNDTGPWGTAYRMGARLDLARGAAQRLGMRGAQYVCVA